MVTSSNTASLAKPILLKSTLCGYCFGVKQALNKARNLLKQDKKVVLDGPLIHNQEVMQTFLQKGARYWQPDEPVAPHEEILIRAHGISPQRRQSFMSLGNPVHDATCPIVSQLAKTIASYTQKGYTILIYGKAQHPEVVGLIGHAGPHCHVLEKAEDIEPLLPITPPVCLVAQTTIAKNSYLQAAEFSRSKIPSLEVLQTLCPWTQKRQQAILDLQKQGAEFLFVVGDTMSSNSKQLVSFAQEHHLPAVLIQNFEMIDLEKLPKFSCFGITGGTSVPESKIDAILQSLENHFSKKKL